MSKSCKNDLIFNTLHWKVAAGGRTLTYGVKILTHRGFFSPRAYSKQKAMPSSSVSQRCISAHSKAMTWLWERVRVGGGGVGERGRVQKQATRVFSLLLKLVVVVGGAQIPQ